MTFFVLKNTRGQFFQQGLTVLELIVVLGILAVLFSLTTINLTRLIPRANVTATVDVLVADLKHQQQKAMSGETGTASASGEPQPFGVHIDANQYVLYGGITYSVASASNSAIPIPNTLQLSTTFPSANILFNRGAGDINGYTSTASATITVFDTVTAQQKVIQLNQLGVVTEVN